MAYPHSDHHPFHLPLPETTYHALCSLAERRQQSTSQLACVAIEEWLKRQEADTLHQAIAEYAKAAAGSADDLDEELEAAALEHWNTIPH